MSNTRRGAGTRSASGGSSTRTAGATRDGKSAPKDTNNRPGPRAPGSASLVPAVAGKRRKRSGNKTESAPGHRASKVKPAEIDGAAVTAALEEAGVPLAEDALADHLGAHSSGTRRKLGRVLVGMTDEGAVVQNRRGLFALPERMDAIAGRVIGHADGYGFVSSGDRATDLYLSPNQMRKVMHGDRVLARVVSVDRRGRREGAVIEVVEKRRQVVGRYVREKGFGYVQPDDRRIAHEITIADKERHGAKNGAMVVVEITHHPAQDRHAGGKVIEVLGDRTEPGMEIEIAIRKHELPHEWPEGLEEKAERKAKAPSKKEIARRVDLRDLSLVTIDGEDARDFDDAVYAEPAGRGWRLVVAIADVSNYVSPGSALDREAFKRGTSVYFPRRVIPMLPEVLSNGMCSLNPDEERLCMFCDMHITASGRVRDFKFGEGIMQSRARLTYTEVGALLRGEINGVSSKTRAQREHLENLNAVFEILRGTRAKRGALELDLPEPFFDLNEDGRIRSISARERNDAHKLIEECMLVANVCAAEFMAEEAGLGVYRIHEEPDPEAVGDLRNFLAEFGVVLGGGTKPKPKDIQAAIERIRSRSDVAPVLQTSILRAMKQAVYSTDNAGHFALGYGAYAHFTSPIRRYPDLMVHRIIRAQVRGEQPGPDDNARKNACEHASMTERRADDASRDVDGFLKAEFMSERLGEEFDAVVTGVTGFGVFVQLQDFFIDGLVHISDLGGDYFHFEAARWRLVGEKSGQVFRLGTRLRVKVASADMEEGRVDFVPAAKPRKGRAGGKGAGRPGSGQARSDKSGAKSRKKSRKKSSKKSRKTSDRKSRKKSDKTTSKRAKSGKDTKSRKDRQGKGRRKKT